VNSFLIIFILIIIFGISIYLYFKDMNSDINNIKYVELNQKCFKCHSSNININILPGGCSGLDTYNFYCNECGEKKSWKVPSQSSCGI
jgi:hypothetical protein